MYIVPEELTNMESFLHLLDFVDSSSICPGIDDQKLKELAILVGEMVCSKTVLARQRQTSSTTQSDQLTAEVCVILPLHVSNGAWSRLNEEERKRELKIAHLEGRFQQEKCIY